MYISPAEAIRRYDVSKPTLYSDMKDGKLSFKFDDRKKRKINVAELDRLYEKRPNDKQSSKSNDVRTGKSDTQSNVKSNTGEIDLLRQEIDYLKRDARVREHETEKWQEAFDKAQATANKITALLEDQRNSKPDRAGALEKSFKTLEARIANQEKTAKEDREERQKILRHNQTLKKALEQEKSKGIWQRIFG